MRVAIPSSSTFSRRLICHFVPKIIAQTSKKKTKGREKRRQNSLSFEENMHVKKQYGFSLCQKMSYKRKPQ